MSNRTIRRILNAVAWSVLAATANAQQPILAHGESTETASQVSGSYQDTWFPYDAVQALTEAESAGGKPSRRTSELGHVWYFDVPAAPAVALQVRAARTDSGEGDDFEFLWSVDQGQRWQSTGYRVDSDTMPPIPDEVGLTADTTTGAALWIRVVDTDHSEGHRSLDTLTVDYLAIVPAEPPPPPAPFWTQAAGMSTSTIFVDWFDLASDEDGYRVERSPAGASAWVVAGTLGADEMLFIDDGLSASTSYDYRVFAFNQRGDSEPSETVTAATRAPGSYVAEVAVPHDFGPRVDFADLALGAGGDVLIGFGGEGVYLNTRDAATQLWSTELVDPATIDDQGGDFGIAPDGTPCFTYVAELPNTPHGTLRFAERRDGAWQIVPIDTETDEDERVSLAFDPSDPDGRDLAIVYSKFPYRNLSYSQDFEPGLFVARRVDGQWTVENLDPDVTSRARPSIAFAPGGELMVAHRVRYKYRGYLYHQLELVVHDGSGWRAPEVVAQLGDVVPGHPSLAVDPVSGLPAIAFGHGDQLRVVRYDGAGWSSETVVAVGADEAIAGVRLEFDDGGQPHVAYSMQTGIFLARHDGAGWVSETIGSAGLSAFATGVGLDFDAQGEAVFCYPVRAGFRHVTVYARR